jgi:hypothetical protein
LLLKRGKHAKIISEWLRHANIEITLDTYSHVLPNMHRDAADDLDAVRFGAATDAAASVREPGVSLEQKRKPPGPPGGFINGLISPGCGVSRQGLEP